MDNLERLKAQAQSIESTSQFARDLLVLFEQIESVQREQVELRGTLDSIQEERDYHIEQNQALEDTVESLQRDKAALIEVLEGYYGKGHMDGGGMARTILEQLK